jgi:hypothetical protein
LLVAQAVAVVVLIEVVRNAISVEVFGIAAVWGCVGHASVFLTRRAVAGLRFVDAYRQLVLGFCVGPKLEVCGLQVLG